MEQDNKAVELAAELTVAWLSNPNTQSTGADVPGFLQSMYDAVSKLGAPTLATPEAPVAEYPPAVSVKKSLASPDHIISMIDGRPYKALRRHLTTNGLTPDEYRQRYNLKSDYPMVSPSYSELRRSMAKTIGLGRKPGQKVKKVSPAAAKAPRRAAAKPALAV